MIDWLIDWLIGCFLMSFLRIGGWVVPRPFPTLPGDLWDVSCNWMVDPGSSLHRAPLTVTLRWSLSRFCRASVCPSMQSGISFYHFCPSAIEARQIMRCLTVKTFFVCLLACMWHAAGRSASGMCHGCLLRPEPGQARPTEDKSTSCRGRGSPSSVGYNYDSTAIRPRYDNIWRPE